VQEWYGHPLSSFRVWWALPKEPKNFDALCVFLKLTFTLLNGRVCELDFCSKHLNSETTLMSLDIWECCIAVCAPAFNIISASQNGATTE